VTTCTISRSEVNRAEIDAFLASIEDLPSIPETLIHILKVIDDPDSGPAELAAAVRRDAPLMSKILKLANSPYYSPRGGIADINRCVAVLGYRTVRQVAVCVSVASAVVSAVEDSSGDLDYRELWRHSVVTAAIAKHLAQLAGHAAPEEIFTAGLLHDVGKFVIELHAPEIYADVVRRRAQTHQRLIDAELEAFGFDHAILGESFARAWRFPEVLARTFGSHHEEVPDAKDDSASWHNTALVALADYLANTIEPSRSDLGFDPTHIDVQALHLAANVTIETVQENLSAMRESVASASSYLNIS
jgi:putative nucleotidyltransferase with HDIG domain